MISDLAELATLAEKYYQSDPNTSLFKCRQFIEVCAKYVSAKIGIYEELKNEKLIYILNQLRKKKVIHQQIFFLFNNIRNLANEEVHLEPQHATTIEPNNDKKKIDSTKALECIGKLHELAIWYHKAFCHDQNKPFIKPKYIIPVDSTEKIKKLEAELIKLANQNQPELVEKIQEQLEDIFIPNEDDTFICAKDMQKLSQGLILRHRYQIVKQLSKGSFGTTYIAYDLDKPNQPLCVVKQFTPSKSNEGTFSKARHLFDLEAKTLQKLGNYSEIPSLFAFFEENDDLFLVQEYIEGNILREELEESWQEKKVVQLLKDILIPLSYVHKNIIVHRDIKPENLIRRAIDGKIVIIDFGAVKQVLEDKKKQGKGTVIGTRAYMSLEQFQGKILFSCDVYAVGIIAIEALMGRKIAEEIYPKQWLAQTNLISDELKQILSRMIATNYEDRYVDAKEALEAIEQWQNKNDESTTIILNPSVNESENQSTNINTSKVTRLSIPKSYLIGGAISLVVLLGLLIKSFPYFLKTKLTQTKLTIGTLWKPESLEGLTEHIEENSVPANYIDFLKGEKIKVRINGDKTLSYNEAQRRMETKTWDIAFANSPILSIFANNQGYAYIAGMFPETINYQGGLFVRKDNPIKSLNDIKPSTRVALGGFNSASSFYMPVYDLYGKTITADIGNRGQDIIDLVRQGNADIGAAAIGDFLRKDDSDFRIIYVSRDIPSSGVYASANLSQLDRENIKKLMLNAPPKVQKEANYGDKPEPDYTEFRKIVKRVEEILVCANFSRNPVTLTCSGNIETIKGTINGVSIRGDDSFIKLSANGRIYNISVPLKIIKELFGSDKLTDIQGKLVQLKTDEEGNNIKVNQLTQIKLLGN
jgi:serine/threonine-protein kinase